MTTVVNITLAMLVVAVVLGVIRIVRTQSIAERVVVLDYMLGLMVCGLAAWSVPAKSSQYLDLMIVVALTSFIATVAVARFIERRGT